jgi:hypothetical protein
MGVRPSDENIGKWLLEVLRHTSQLEYYAGILNIGSKDPERPHDIVGPNNKLEWDIIKSCAWAYSDSGCGKDKELCDEISEAVKRHRQQYHHAICMTDLAREDDLRFEALDTICAMLEHRPYYAHVHNFEELEANLESYIACNGRHEQRLASIREVLPLMRSLERPDIRAITTLEEFPNLGADGKTYDKICQRFSGTLELLRREHNYSG